MLIGLLPFSIRLQRKLPGRQDGIRFLPCVRSCQPVKDSTNLPGLQADRYESCPGVCTLCLDFGAISVLKTAYTPHCSGLPGYRSVTGFVCHSTIFMYCQGSGFGFGRRPWKSWEVREVWKWERAKRATAGVVGGRSHKPRQTSHRPLQNSHMPLQTSHRPLQTSHRPLH